MNVRAIALFMGGTLSLLCPGCDESAPDSDAASLVIQGAPIDAPIDNAKVDNPEIEKAGVNGASGVEKPNSGSEVFANRSEDSSREVVEPPVDQPEGKYKHLTFQPLTDFRIAEPDWDRVDDKEYVASLELEEGIPEKVKALNGKQVEMLGFMFPLDVRGGNALNFLLLPNMQMCCFGQVPRLNEWVYIVVPEGIEVEAKEDILLTVSGELKVGITYDPNDMLAGIYSMVLEDVRLDH